MSINYKKLSVIVLVSCLIALSYNTISPTGISLIRKEITVENVSRIDYDSSTENVNELLGIEFETMKELVSDSRAIIIDSRDQWEYGEGHIPGAISIPEFSFDPQSEVVINLNKEKVYIIYCEGDDCDVSKRLAKEFTKLGFSKVYVYLGGFAEWVENDMQVGVLE
jgi:rhodanese-related sulfurtransferase